MLIKNYKSKCNYSQVGGEEEGTFLESSLPPGGDPLNLTCGSGVPGVLPGTAHTFRDKTRPSASPPAPRLGRAGALPVGRPAEPALHIPSLGLGRWKAWGDQATPMDSSCPTQRSKGTRQCHSGLCQSQGALLHPPTEMSRPAVAPWSLSHKLGRNSAKPGAARSLLHSALGSP